MLSLGSRDAGSDPDTPIAEYFAAQVKKISGGKLRIHVVLDAAGDDVPDTEARIVRMVRDGRLDLGWIGARVWDELGVTSFQALQAPFLIDSYPLLERVTTGPLAREMLAGLKRDDVVGLALVPELLRHPVGLKRPFLSPSDFAGARIADFPSRASDSLLRALGATPVHLSNTAVGRDRDTAGRRRGIVVRPGVGRLHRHRERDLLREGADALRRRARIRRAQPGAARRAAGGREAHAPARRDAPRP